MTSSQWIELSRSIAWPVVGLLALIYIWRSDAIGKLIKISDAVRDLRDRLKELVEVEERLRESTSTIIEITTTLNDLQSEFLLMKADIQSIRDNVDQRHALPVHLGQKSVEEEKQLKRMFTEMDNAWQTLTQTMTGKFGYFDLRSTGSAAHRFTHGNRGVRLTGDQAEEIARLHSSIKSYRRRQSYLSDWLDEQTKDQFLSACENVADQLQKI